MLTNCQEKRISAKQALEHPYFADVSSLLPTTTTLTPTTLSASTSTITSSFLSSSSPSNFYSSSPILSSISPVPSSFSHADKHALSDNSNILNQSNNNNNSFYFGKPSALYNSNNTTLSANSSPNPLREPNENDNILTEDNSDVSNQEHSTNGYSISNFMDSPWIIDSFNHALIFKNYNFRGNFVMKYFSLFFHNSFLDWTKLFSPTFNLL